MLPGEERLRLGRAFVAPPFACVGNVVRQAAVLAIRFLKAVLRLSSGRSWLKRPVMSRTRCSSTFLVSSFWSFFFLHQWASVRPLVSIVDPALRPGLFALAG